jgi:hypothetical protein
MKRDAAGSVRFCAWNARFANGDWFGETQAAPDWSGFVQIDVSRDANPDSQRSVICYHYNGLSYIDIDAGNLYAWWPHDPKTPEYDGYLWPVITVASNNNILMATGDINNWGMVHLFLTTDEGVTWTLIADFDSSTASHFLRASRNLSSHKVAFVRALSISDTIARGQFDQNVWYMLSTDDGVTWGPEINVTNYQPLDSVRAYWDLHANFDIDDNLHIVWGGRRVVNGAYYQASKIFHWDEVNDTITVVSSPSIYYNDPGGWWITTDSGGDPGAWRMPADQPQLIVDPATGWLYCLWHGNDDYTDTSAAGYFNGEFYGSYSSDNGITWSEYVNLTNTRSPGAPAGECMDEDYMTANPFIVNDSIFVTYIEDKDAGSAPHNEGVETENPVRCWVFHKGLISGITEEKSMKPEYSAPILEVYPNPFHDKVSIVLRAESKQVTTLGSMPYAPCINIYDALGKFVKNLLPTSHFPFLTSLVWYGDDDFGRRAPAGVYFVQMKMGGKNILEKIIKLK